VIEVASLKVGDGNEGGDIGNSFVELSMVVDNEDGIVEGTVEGTNQGAVEGNNGEFIEVAD